jgi:hypothetical protein
VLSNINAIIASFGKPHFARLAELFARPKRLLATFPKLDPYGTRKDGRYPSVTSRIQKAVNWRSGSALSRWTIGQLDNAAIPAERASIEAQRVAGVELFLRPRLHSSSTEIVRYCPRATARTRQGLSCETVPDLQGSTSGTASAFDVYGS